MRYLVLLLLLLLHLVLNCRLMGALGWNHLLWKVVQALLLRNLRVDHYLRLDLLTLQLLRNRLCWLLLTRLQLLVDLILHLRLSL